MLEYATKIEQGARAPLSLAVPAKVVLFGEYFVLLGERAYGATLDSYHYITCTCESYMRKQADTDTHGMRIWKSLCEMLDMPLVGYHTHHRADFPSHYGWGGSSAFVMALICLAYVLRHHVTPDRAAIWMLFQEVRRRCKLPGSGIDMYTQLSGKPWTSYVQGQAWNGHAMAPDSTKTDFNQYALAFIPLGYKVRSHEALAKIHTHPKLRSACVGYRDIMRNVVSGIEANDWATFRAAVSEGALLILNAVEAPADYIRCYQRWSSMVEQEAVIKPSGAVGGDGFLMWIRREVDDVLKLFCQEKVSPVVLRLGGQMQCRMQMP